MIQRIRHQHGVELRILVNGQHRLLLDQVLELFKLQPDRDLKAMRANQHLDGLTARVLREVEQDLLSHRPDWMMVQGDTTTPFAAAMAAYFTASPSPTCNPTSQDLQHNRGTTNNQ